ncbi:MAG: hypothetical protein ACI8ZB_001127 [Desulforhopalus sp.]
MNNNEKTGGSINSWKLIEIKTKPCSFVELADCFQGILYDGKRQNPFFPYNYNALETTGDFAVVLLAEDLNHLVYLEKLLSKRGVKRN